MNKEKENILIEKEKEAPNILIGLNTLKSTKIQIDGEPDNPNIRRLIKRIDDEIAHVVKPVKRKEVKRRFRKNCKYFNSVVHERRTGCDCMEGEGKNYCWGVCDKYKEETNK